LAKDWSSLQKFFDQEIIKGVIGSSGGAMFSNVAPLV
jgi:hypothetical protein